MKLSFKTGKWFGVLIATISYAYIIYRLLNFKSEVPLSSISPIEIQDWLWLILVQVILLLFNLFLESKKWQVLLNSLKQVGFKASFKMVLAGFASGIFTPAKIGEPVGRILFLPKEIWAKASLLNYIGGAIHNLVIGAVGLLCLLTSWNILSESGALALNAILLFLVISFCGLLLWLKRSWLKKQLLRWSKFGTTIVKLWDFSKSISRKDLNNAFLLSIARFAVYCVQMILLLYFFDAQLNVILLALVPVYFLLITLIPSFFLADVGIRGSVALYVFSHLAMSDVTIVLMVSILWFLNQVVPAALGSLLILGKK